MAINFLNEFEDRIGSIFGAAPAGYAEPFSFKKLAKRAAKEMEAETLDINGVDTAPALYTVLVSGADDALMRPLYAQISEETSAYLYAQGKQKGYAFVGDPLVRFMVDPSLRSGKFAVFAENVDARSLERLRREEEDFLGGNSSVGGAASAGSNAAHAAAHAARPHSRSHARKQAPKPAPKQAPEPEAVPGIVPIPEGGGVVSAAPAVPSVEPDPIDNVARMEDLVPDVAVSVAPVAEQPRRRVPLVDERDQAEPEPVVEDVEAAKCMLIDRQTGRTYSAEAPSAVIGRERATSDIVLTDPNVSRRHAQLSYDGSRWHVIDLRSTNGTLVNDVDVNECTLKSGDLVTIGLTNLEFREM